MMLLDKKAPVNRQNITGDTSLTIAAANGHDQIAQTLLSGGANARVKNHHGKLDSRYLVTNEGRDQRICA